MAIALHAGPQDQVPAVTQYTDRHESSSDNMLLGSRALIKWRATVWTGDVLERPAPKQWISIGGGGQGELSEGTTFN